MSNQDSLLHPVANATHQQPQAEPSLSRPYVAADDMVLRIRQVADRLGVARTTIYYWVRKGEFPKPIQLGGGSVGWLTSDVQSFLEQRVRASRQTA